ncbi:MAG TPA: glycosyltransferase family 2 protein [Acidimicrobiales bacterium]|nr:glycosyltransferase family 2 protein [Acidimicrobiales bacterium]
MTVVRAVVVAVLVGFDWAVIGYFVAINTSYFLLLMLAATEFVRYLRWLPFVGYEETRASPLSPPVSIIVPAYNEEAGIATSVSAMLALQYPEFEVVVVIDGAKDRTFEVLRESFDLVEVPRVVTAEIPVRAQPTGIWVPRGNAPLTVVVKNNSGRADSLNLGINVARYPLVCMVDADSILDAESLLHVAQPFVDDPDRVVASGGVIRAANGCTVRHGRIVEVRMPREWLARIQVVEYLRAFLLGRTGWSKLNALLVISGAFGLFRRDVLVAAGGLDAGCIGEDAELVVRIHRMMREAHRDYRVVFVAEPVSWTEVPTTLKVLGRQRRRWSRGLAEIVWRHRGMILNPRYGRIGLVALPYYILFELLAPIIEVTGVFAVILGVALGLVNLTFGALFLLVAVLYALALSIASLLLEEVSFHRYRRWRDLGTAVVVSLIENVGYRQATAVFQLQGLWAAIRGGQQVWGDMARAGFVTTSTATTSTATTSPGGDRESRP